MSTNPKYPDIFQRNPVYEKPSHFPAKGWTETVVGYQKEAKKWVYGVIQNSFLMKRPYKWVLHLNLNSHVLPKDVSPMWQKVCESLKGQGIIALWVREPNRENKIHYHIIVKSNVTKKELNRAIKKAMPPRSVANWRSRPERIKSLGKLANYIFKAKVSGFDENGNWVADLHAPKRLLFIAKLPFKKVGSIGKFWESGMSVPKFWDQLKAKEEKKRIGLMDSDIRHLCRYVFELFDGHVPRAAIERQFGLNAESHVLREWIEKLRQGGWAEDYWKPGAGQGRPEYGRAI